MTSFLSTRAWKSARSLRLVRSSYGYSVGVVITALVLFGFHYHVL